MVLVARSKKYSFNFYRNRLYSVCYTVVVKVEWTEIVHGLVLRRLRASTSKTYGHLCDGQPDTCVVLLQVLQL